MSLDGGMLNLTNWTGNVIMPTLAGLFGAAAIYRFGKAQPWQHLAWAGVASLMCSGLLRVLEGQWFREEGQVLLRGPRAQPTDR